MNRTEIAVNYFNSGFNCAQSVVLAFKNLFEIDEHNLAKISCGLGGGLGRLQETCGTVTGACLVIGLLNGNKVAEDNHAKEKTYELVQLFHKEFTLLHKTTKCKELLNCNLLTEEGKNYFHDNNLKEKVCIKCIEDAVKILENSSSKSLSFLKQNFLF